MFCKLLFLALYVKYIVIKDHFLEITWERYTVHNMLNELLIKYFLVWFSHPNILYQGANHAALGWPIHLKRRHSAFYRCKIVSLTDSHTLNRRPLVWKCKHKKNDSLPDECGEVSIHVNPRLEPLCHAERCVRPHPAVPVEQEDPDDVTLCLQIRILIEENE